MGFKQKPKIVYIQVEKYKNSYNKVNPHTIHLLPGHENTVKTANLQIHSWKIIWLCQIG